MKLVVGALGTAPKEVEQDLQRALGKRVDLRNFFEQVQRTLTHYAFAIHCAKDTLQQQLTDILSNYGFGGRKGYQEAEDMISNVELSQSDIRNSCDSN